MGQIKIFGLASELTTYKARLSDIIHSCIVESLNYPKDKRFHRFFPMERANFIFPEGRSDKYTIIEISMFEGRSAEAKKSLIRLLFKNIEEELSIEKDDIEITIFESPRSAWGIRGLPADELGLNYKINV